MKIADVKLTGLSGGTVEGGWAEELTPEDNVHTVVEVVTDGGLVGVGSVFTSRDLVAAAVKLLRPFLIGERADEPARVTEKLRQSCFWQGRGGAVEHAISGIDIALWDLFGKITNQPVSRLLGGWLTPAEQDFGLVRLWDFDVSENDKEIVIRAEMPGFDEGEVDVQANQGVLTIRAENEQNGDRQD